MSTVTQPSSAPTRKVTAAGAAGAVAVIVAYVLGEVGVELTDEVVAALTTLLTVGAGYVVRDGV